MAGKVIVSKFMICEFMIQVVRVSLFVCCNGVWNSGLSSTEKFKSNETLFNWTQGEFNAAFSSWIPSVFVVQFKVQMIKLKRLAKTCRKRICIRTEDFSDRFTTKNCLREFRYWMNENLTNKFNCQQIPYSFNFLSYFLRRIKSQ